MDGVQALLAPIQTWRHTLWSIDWQKISKIGATRCQILRLKTLDQSVEEEREGEKATNVSLDWGVQTLLFPTLSSVS